MRVTHHAIERFRHRCGFDWATDQVACRLRYEAMTAIAEGRTEPARGDALLVRFTVAGVELAAIVAEDSFVPEVQSIVTVFRTYPKQAARAAEGEAA